MVSSFHNGDLEALFEQFAQVAFNAEVRQHPRQDDLVDAALAELQDRLLV
jgi:hypothetical protein